MSTPNNTNAFRVVWEIDVYADNAVEAAKEAWRQMREPASTACFFKAIDEDGVVWPVDLMDYEGDENV